MKFLQKTGQISIFVIISAILVIGLITLLSLNTASLPLFSDSKPSATVKNYVESCVELESQEALRQIALHGGWLYGPDAIFTDRDQPDVLNRQATGLSFLEQIDMRYWHYYDDSSERFILNIPEYDTNSEFSIKSQLEMYVEDNIESCFDEFTTFEDLYEITVDDSTKGVEANIVEGEVIRVTLSYPMQITEVTTNTTEYMTTFDANVDDRLWVPYNLAKDITLAQAQTSFFEKRMMQFLTPYQSSEDRDLLPPFYDFRMVYDFEPWQLSSVETLIKQLISTHISRIQFYNTNYEEPALGPALRSNEFAQAFNTLYTKDYISEVSTTDEEEPRLFDQYKDYTVKPTFEPFFPSTIDISPSMGDQILLPRPQAVVDFIPFFFTEYVAVYEMTMPIVVEIEPSRSNTDFIFNLALETNIDHNTALKENYDVNFEFSDYNLDQNNALVCDPPQFISEYVYLNITDSIFNGARGANDPEQGVEGATVSFSCKGISTCYVGETQTVDILDGTATQMQFRLPINCDPGTLEVFKAGHKKLVFENVNPTLDQTISLGEVDMPSKKKLKAQVKLVSPSASQFSQGRDIGEQESAFVIIQSLEDENMVEVLEVTSDNQYDQTLNLLPGNYSVQGFIMHQDSFTIPSERICYKSGLFSEDCETLPEITMESWVKGGIEIDSFEITTKQLLNQDFLTISLIDVPLPTSYTQLSEISTQLNELHLTSVGKEPYLE